MPEEHALHVRVQMGLGLLDGDQAAHEVLLAPAPRDALEEQGEVQQVGAPQACAGDVAPVIDLDLDRAQHLVGAGRPDVERQFNAEDLADHLLQSLVERLLQPHDGVLFEQLSRGLS